MTVFVTRSLFDPVIAHARAELRERLGQAQHADIPAGVHAGWEAYLHERLTVVSSKAVAWQFQIFKTARAAFTVPDARGLEQAAVVRDFVEQPEKRLRQLYGEYPLLEQLNGTLVRQWVGAVTEFVGRFWADQEMLSTWFGKASASQLAVAVEPGLSDPHRSGRTVVRVYLANGSTLIYKPRSLAPENHYEALLAFVNGLGCPRPFRSAQSVDRGAYGWMEDVLAHPCSDVTEVESFYWRAGALLGLVFLAGGVDMHRENLIAVGEQPVLIDLETLMHPQNEAGKKEHPGGQSLLRTGFLPTKTSFGSALVHTGALLCSSNLSGGSQNSSHLPVFADRQFPATDFSKSIARGFDWIGDALFRDHLVTAQFTDRLHALCRCPRRRILRSTAAYSRILEDLTSPRLLRQTPSAASAIKQISKNHGLVLNNAEISSLANLEIPYFQQRERSEAVASSFLLPTREAFMAERRTIAVAFGSR